MRTNLALGFLLCALALLAAAPVAAGDGVADEAMDRARLQNMLVEGDTGMVVATFKRYPGRVLPFVDSYFEGGLAMIEKEGEVAAERAKASYRMGIKFAKLAEEALSEKAFTEYANAFASWSPSEQKRFREGQRLFREARKLAKEDPKRALSMLEESLSITVALGDLWGQAMARASIGALLAQSGPTPPDGSTAMVERGLEESLRAANLYTRLRLSEDQAEAFLSAGRACLALQRMGGAYSHLSSAWGIVHHDSSIALATRKSIGEEFARALDATGRPAEAAEVRAAIEAMERASTPATAK